MRSKAERGQLRQIVQSSQWGTVLALAEELCVKIREGGGAKETEWETVRDTILIDGRVQGIQLLIQTLERESNELET